MASLGEQQLVNSFNKVFLGAAGTSGEVSPDDQFNRVSFLSHFEGSNNGVNNVFDDGSANNYTVIAAGNVTQGSFSPFSRPDGEWGVSFDGSNDRLRTNASNLDITTEAFTAEAWIFPVKSMDQYDIIVCMFASSHGSNSNQTWSIRAGANNTIEIVTISSSTQTTQSAGTANIGAWNHVAISKNGTTMYAALNGAVTSKSCASSLNGHEYFYIGAADANGSGAYFFNGVISNVRYEIGNARYTSNYTVPTSKLTATTNTKILTCQSNRFVDNSTSNNTFLISSTPEVTAFGPFLSNAVYDPAVNGASAYMDGSGDTLRVAWTAADIVNQNFTLEYWIYFQDTSGYGSVSISGSSGGGNAIGDDGLAHLSYQSNGFVFTDDGQSSGSGPATSAGAINPNSWNHLALVRVSDNMFTYINGVQAATKAINTSLFDEQSVELGVGVLNNIEGYVCDVRLVTSAVYTGNFTAPTAPLAAITNTKVLLNMADGQAIDSAAQNNLTLFGNAKISTAQAKFGNTSMVFDGTGDYVTLPSSSFTPFGTGNFTIECFARFDAIDGKGLFQLGASYLPSAVTGPAVFASIATNNPWRIYYGTSDVDASVSPSANTWYHVAYVRSSGVTKLYVDGTSVISENDTTDYTNTFFVIGGGYSSSFLMDGYIDDFRISHMARYTSNFTAPTAAFADKGQ